MSLRHTREYALNYSITCSKLKLLLLRYIKMSSPHVNNIIIFGGLLCYVKVILDTLDSRFLSLEAYGRFCNVSRLKIPRNSKVSVTPPSAKRYLRRRKGWLGTEEKSVAK